MQDNQIEVIQRNIELFQDKELFIAGNVNSPLVLHIAKICKSCHILCDSFITFKQIADTLNLDIDNTMSQTINYKHVYIHFLAIDNIDKCIEASFDTVLLFLTKSKDSIKKTLYKIQDKLKEKSLIYIIGENASGGKSADKLIASKNSKPYKVDTARKCTLFASQYTDKYAEVSEKTISYKIDDIELNLLSKVGVFSLNKIDEGTHKLISVLKDNINAGSYLDLGCGCGVISIYLAKLQVSDITLCDVSANALFASYENAKLNNVDKYCKFIASDMLNNVGKFDNIVSNPPFHDGIKTSIDVTLNMFKQLKDHLNAKGQVIIVGNTFLMYTDFLASVFNNVEKLSEDTKFTVLKSINN